MRVDKVILSRIVSRVIFAAVLTAFCASVYALEFEAEGVIDAYFVPIRPGTYEYFVENDRESGMLGAMEVK